MLHLGHGILDGFDLLGDVLGHFGIRFADGRARPGKRGRDDRPELFLEKRIIRADGSPECGTRPRRTSFPTLSRASRSASGSDFKRRPNSESAGDFSGNTRRTGERFLPWLAGPPSYTDSRVERETTVRNPCDDPFRKVTCEAKGLPWPGGMPFHEPSIDRPYPQRPALRRPVRARPRYPPGSTSLSGLPERPHHTTACSSWRRPRRDEAARDGECLFHAGSGIGGTIFRGLDSRLDAAATEFRGSPDDTPVATFSDMNEYPLAIGE